jgi:hypothetical protein
LLAGRDPKMDASQRQQLAADTSHRVTAWTQQELAGAIERNVTTLMAIKKTLDEWGIDKNARASSEEVLTVVIEAIGSRLGEAE